MRNLKELWEHYKKPTPVKWRRIGDYILLITGFVVSVLPTLPLPETKKAIIGAACTFIGISLKFWTNTQKTPGPEDKPDNTNGQQPTENT